MKNFDQTLETESCAQKIHKIGIAAYTPHVFEIRKIKLVFLCFDWAGPNFLKDNCSIQKKVENLTRQNRSYET